MEDVQGIKVAVRVRPFNQRERNARSDCVVTMNGNYTTLTNPESKEHKTFVFDYSYWSHSDYEEDADGVYFPTSDKYADQRRVFQDLGQGVLDNAWAGYNATLFAYGQTGAGKSYSVVGYGANKGIVPITCEELFIRTRSLSQEADKTFQVSYSMLEIYNENVRDLLAGDGGQSSSSSSHTAGGGKSGSRANHHRPQAPLKVRQNPKYGFYVEGLKVVPVESYDHIKSLMEQGTLNRTTAATNLNATSSRSHMLIRVAFKQIFLNDVGESTTKSSEINLVDLAGSERSNTAGTSGDRLKEGSAINQSLLTLGNVISALADNALKKSHKTPVPYRDSELTKLLQSSLGGNSKTVMIAALSPAAINHDESLSTLRFADRVKKIKNNAVVNESPTDRLIRELKEENQRLMKQLERAATAGRPETMTSPSDVEGVDAQRMLEENQRQMEEMEKSWRQRLDEAKKEFEKKQEEIRKKEDDDANTLCNLHPYLRNVNEDAQLSGVIRQVIKPGDQILGKGGGDVAVSILLRGLGILQQHAFITNKSEEVTIRPFSQQAKIAINGVVVVAEEKVLHHLDRIKLGSNNLFIFVGFPSHRDNKNDEAKISQFDYDFLQAELARGSELLFQRDDSNALRDVTFMNFLQLMPQVGEVNSMSEELAKKHHNANVKFEPLIKNLATYDDTGNEKKKEVLVKMTNLKTNQVWVWSRAKFINRKYLIEELYNQIICEGKEMTLEKKSDPFWDPPEDVFLGSSHAWLQPLAYQVEVDDQLEMHGHHGDEVALAQVQIHPCTSEGKLLGEEATVLEPSELLGGRVDFMLQIRQVVGVRWVQEDKKNRGFYFAFKFFDLPKLFKSKTIWGKSSAKLGFKKQFTIKSVNSEFLEYLQTHALVLEVWGAQSGGDVRDADSSPSSEDQLDVAPKETETNAKNSQESLDSSSRGGILERSLSRVLSRQNSDRMMRLKSTGPISRISCDGVGGIGGIGEEAVYIEDLEAERNELRQRVEELQARVNYLETENAALLGRSQNEEHSENAAAAAAVAATAATSVSATLYEGGEANMIASGDAAGEMPTLTRDLADAGKTKANVEKDIEKPIHDNVESVPTPAQNHPEISDVCGRQPDVAPVTVTDDVDVESNSASQKQDPASNPDHVSNIDHATRQSVLKALKKFFADVKTIEKEMEDYEKILLSSGKSATDSLDDDVKRGAVNSVADDVDEKADTGLASDNNAHVVTFISQSKEVRGKLNACVAKLKGKMKTALKTRKEE